MARRTAVAATNPWPDFDFNAYPRTVHRVLIEQGSGIREKTDGVLTLQVVTTPDEEGHLVHNCYLVVKAIDFRYPFLVVRENAKKKVGYPVEIHCSANPRYEANNEVELIDGLRKIFGMDQTKEAVAALYDLVAT